ncbi:MAG: hypothetical protein NWE96_07245 [Candidatus Bathyarchaeota archaeon]|nr:hypothetical protein [Candidatus Bathyarchaeota archaeon]
MRRIGRQRGTITVASINLNKNRTIQISPFRYAQRHHSTATASPDLPSGNRTGIKRKRGYIH